MNVLWRQLFSCLIVFLFGKTSFKGVICMKNNKQIKISMDEFIFEMVGTSIVVFIIYAYINAF